MSATLLLDTTTSRLMLGLAIENALSGSVPGEAETARRLISRCISTDSHRYHSALIAPAIQDLLDEAGCIVHTLTALAVNMGPGSFTGIRTGVATIRTMAQVLGVPVHAFNTFELLAFSSLQPEAAVSVSLDALRGRAYHAVLRFDADGPRYLSEPVLQTRSTELSRPETDLVITAIPEHWDSVVAMHGLLTAYGNRFSRPWQEVRPLYLQEPSITLRKK